MAGSFDVAKAWNIKTPTQLAQDATQKAAQEKADAEAKAQEAARNAAEAFARAQVLKDLANHPIGNFVLVGDKTAAGLAPDVSGITKLDDLIASDATIDKIKQNIEAYLEKNPDALKGKIIVASLGIGNAWKGGPATDEAIEAIRAATPGLLSTLKGAVGLYGEVVLLSVGNDSL